MKMLGKILLAAVSIAYPLLWYYGREAGVFVWLSAAMAVLWLMRAVMQKMPAQRAVSLVLAGFFAAVCWADLPQTMYWYPTAVSLLMLLLFGGSLFAEQTLVERLARLQHPDLPPEGVRYTRRITQIWCVFFILNGGISAVLVLFQCYEWWAFYTGLLSYLLMGVLTGGEWLYRKSILKL